ncbi:hypothetical protein N9783_03765, partial [Planktomarina temperata]|nr:hypothetical protein [Planktomarina temperata]
MGNNIALVTGRGGSSFKDKNIRKIAGFEAVKFPAAAAVSSGLFDYFYCSSDSEKIMQCCEPLGYEPIRRPDELASPTSLHISAIDHAINEISKRNIEIDYLYVFLANNV